MIFKIFVAVIVLVLVSAGYEVWSKRNGSDDGWLYRIRDPTGTEAGELNLLGTRYNMKYQQKQYNALSKEAKIDLYKKVKEELDSWDLDLDHLDFFNSEPKSDHINDSGLELTQQFNEIEEG